MRLYRSNAARLHALGRWVEFYNGPPLRARSWSRTYPVSSGNESDPPSLRFGTDLLLFLLVKDAKRHTQDRTMGHAHSIAAKCGTFSPVLVTRSAALDVAPAGGVSVWTRPKVDTLSAAAMLKAWPTRSDRAIRTSEGS